MNGEAGPSQDPAGVEQLCEESARQLRVDLGRAERLARDAERLAEQLQDPWARGRARRALANVKHQQGDYRRAETLYDEAVDAFLSAGDRLQEAITRSSALHNLIYLGRYERAREWAAEARRTFRGLGDRLRLARLDLNYANILYRQDRWQEALDLYQTALGELEAVGSAEDVAVCLRNTAVCHISLNHLLQALEVYQRARRHCVANDLPLLVAEIDYNVAYLHYLRGDHTRAIQLYKAAGEKSEELGDDMHLALCDLDRSEIFLELNLIEEAAQLADWAYDRFERLGMRYESAKALTNLAIATVRQGRAFLAIELLGKAREMFAAEENRQWPALLDLYQALVLYGEGRLFESSSLALRARRAFAGSSFASRLSMCDVLLARLSLERGKTASAREYATAAIDRLRPLNLPALTLEAYFVLGRLEELVGNRDAALRAYEASQSALERLRGHVRSEELKITFLEDRLVVYESLVALRVGEAQEDAGATVFSYFEKAKSRSLADLIAFRAHALPSKSTTRSNLVDEIRSLREELNWYYRQIDLRQMRSELGAPDQVSDLRQSSRRQEAKLLETLRELHRTDQELGAIQDASTVELDVLRAALPADLALLEYYIARGSIYGAVLTHEGLEIAPLTRVSRVREIYRLLQFQLAKLQDASEAADGEVGAFGEATRNHLRSLYDELVAPLADRLDRARLVVVPHGHLHHLPFHAFFDGERFLIDRHAISYAPSAGVLHLCRAKTVAYDERALVLDADGDDSRMAEAGAPLDPMTCEVVGDGEAAIEALKRRAERCRVVHLAARAVYRQDNPMFSAIEMAGSRLNFFDLYSLRLNAQVFVLTRCGTSLEQVTSGDERVGLVRGLLYAGAKAVLLGLWDADRESTAAFLAGFYRHLAAGRPTGEALQAAQIEHRAERPHPFYWARFALVGDPG